MFDLCNVVDDQDLKGPVNRSRTLLGGVSTDIRKVRTHHTLGMGFVSATPHWRLSAPVPARPVRASINRKSASDRNYTVPSRLWRKLSGAGPVGSLANCVVHITEKVGRCVFDFSDTVRMNSRLHLGVPFKV